MGPAQGMGDTHSEDTHSEDPHSEDTHSKKLGQVGKARLDAGAEDFLQAQDLQAEDDMQEPTVYRTWMRT